MSTESFPDVPGLRAKSPEFLAAFAAVIDRLGLDGDHLAAVISLESGFNAQARNPVSRATGLIQWMPATAPLFGTTVDKLFEMTDLEQLPYVERYFAGHKLAPRDIYLQVFMPKFIGHEDGEIIASKGEKVYDQNAGLDIDHDGDLTVGNVRDIIENRLMVAHAKPRIPVPTSVGGGSSASSSAGSKSGAHGLLATMLFSALFASLLLRLKGKR